MKKYNSIQEVHPEIIQLWEAAWQMQPHQVNPWIVDFGTQKQATSMRQRMYSVRKKLITENYPNAVNFNKLEIGQDKDDPTRLRFYLPEWVLNAQKALTEAGVELKVPEQAAPTPPEVPLSEELIHQMFPPMTPREERHE